MMVNFAMHALRPAKYNLCIVAAVAMISGCQGLDAARTDAVFIEPVVHPLRSKPAVQPIYVTYQVHTLRADPEILMTSTVPSTGSTYAFSSPQAIKVRTLGPVKVAFSPGDGGPLLGSAPYICSPSGFGRLASCHPRYL
ncbi:hypothetical protein [Mesorhizobium erdmanii]|uniref:Uncharacterized protein n=1 Tax=Mesorhizobium erdmanii TaxID=1777866 RepID=A0A6M7USU3_9HYPH|nr:MULTISPECIES: hypothetical protein [Mesorhizobium]OBQ60229.1 hypothetical protein A8146_18720 [Mesorhizobium loti]QKC80056.1 hypothetical protein EB233_23630 [Mesorhizobium erdmanii]